MDCDTTHTLLSAIHNAIHAALMPLYTDMLRICKASPRKARILQGNGAGNMAHPEMQPPGEAPATTRCRSSRAQLKRVRS